MSVSTPSTEKKTARFRIRLMAAIMLIVSTLTALGLYVVQHKVSADAERDLRERFQAELLSLHKLEQMRHAALAERCHALASKPRIHAALEDNALDLLYPSAKDELRDLMEGEEEPGAATGSLQAKFYRFLDGNGAVLMPPNPKDVGGLNARTESQLALKRLPETQQLGYVEDNSDGANGIVDEVIAVPIFSTDTGVVISALVVGFKPLALEGKHASAGMKSGIWVNGRLHLPSLPESAQAALSDEIAGSVAKSNSTQSNVNVTVDDAPQLLFYKRLNPDSLFPPAYEICVYPLADSVAQLHRLWWQIGAAGGLVLLAGFVASHFIAARLSEPVEKLALDSEVDRAQRRRAESALASTTDELERSTRYSANASHQLKSPVAVLRAGLETLLAREDFKPEVYEELSDLLHQTSRLTGVINDLLLLSRIDAGHFQIASHPVNLSRLVDDWLDDLAALPDSPDIQVDKKFPANLYVAGEKQYTSLIVQNLLENAHKYNRLGGRMRVFAHKNTNEVVLDIGNTGQPISPDAQEHIFERFHRGSNRSSVSGHGLGLSLARDLARLHGGDLRLVRSEADWTEFEARFRIADPMARAASEVA